MSYLVYRAPTSEVLFGRSRRPASRQRGMSLVESPDPQPQPERVLFIPEPFLQLDVDLVVEHRALHGLDVAPDFYLWLERNTAPSHTVDG